MDDPEDLEAAVARAAAGDGAAFTMFVRATQADIRRTCAVLVDAQSADDLAQETFVRAYQSLGRYDGTAAARTWLIGIARHVCSTEVRRRARRRRLAARMGWRSPLIDEGHAAAVDIWQCVTQLPFERREAFVLTQVMGFSYDETARMCGCPVGTVRSRVARARHELIVATSDSVATTASRRVLGGQ